MLLTLGDFLERARLLLHPLRDAHRGLSSISGEA